MNALTRASVVLGTGLGGFLDGIVFHQILGWHHLVCVTATCGADTVQGLRDQITDDGWFHAAVWIVTVIGVVLLFRAGGAKDRIWTLRHLGGGMLSGWGAFNIVEGTINHFVLELHHVRPGSPNELWWDLGFVIVGGVLVLLGWAITRPAHPPTSPHSL